MTSLVGRRAETSEVKRLLSAARLVTLTGVGGVGKTRLAQHVARQVRRAFTDGVWWVELADLADPELLPLTVAEAVGLSTPSADPTAALCEYLDDRQVLLCLDNCEHLVDASATVVRKLLSSCPNLRILATSREPLAGNGEHVFVVPPLPVPSSSDGDGQDADAVRLFAERASDVLPGFAVTTENASDVVELCRSLDGLPLAIELAAVRMRSLSAQHILSYQQDRFRLLARGRRTVQARHQTLRAAVDWSFDLCTEPERLLWARLSVFAGGFDIEAAEVVCAGHGLDRENVLDALLGLVDKSIVVREEIDGRTRYQLLETIRQYGRDRLAERGDEALVRRQHRDHYLTLAELVRDTWFGPGQVALFARVRAEHANLRAAMEFCLTHPGEARVGLRIAGLLWAYWLVCGLLDEGRVWLDRALAADPEPSPDRTHALWSNGNLAVRSGETTLGLRMLEECVDLAERSGDRAALAHATHLSGIAEVFAGRTERGAALIEESIRIERELPNPNPYLTLGNVNLGHVASCYLGDVDRAIRIFEQCVRDCAAVGEDYVRSSSLVGLGITEWIRGDRARARNYLRDGIRQKWAFRDLVGLTMGFDALAWTAMADGDARYAATLLGAGRMLAQPLGSTLGASARLHEWSDRCAEEARRGLGAEAFDAAFARGRQFTGEEAVAYALGENGQAREEPPRPKRSTGLTRREAEVAELVAAGLANKEIANRLVIAQRTAETHVERILAKLGFNSRTQIVKWHMERQETEGPRTP
ncbi:MAG TPA: LuxR C-terminal-related transcriptional regulator [Amycolatopsis sp.]|uniref:ATP-binding protein n=1 Tax=Amycolatopsis sp. TaxID=37632 RepID=UPI002B45F796|nr:LuxR C-terminal-related transcriptional regulator [Amycolatopsis sp.]HKS44246.1 LuxR C-terminal-related transcriptional regulator [Amycolatopsis sp.]